MRHRPLLSIVGITATGKTSLALQLSEVLLKQGIFPGIDIISADSRQVYQGLETLTGADVPSKFRRVGDYFVWGQLKIHGISIIKPTANWSLADFQHFAQRVLHDSWAAGRLPILVGGTGLYHQHLFNQQLAHQPGQNQAVRRRTDQLSLDQVQTLLKRLDLAAWEKLTQSDRQNKRRLVRKIELASSEKKSATSVGAIEQPSAHLTIGLSAEPADLLPAIAARVKNRLAMGALDEVKRLQANYGDKSLPAWTATGITELTAYLNQELTDQACLDRWAQRELQYAKRQITWWKKRSGVNWFPAQQPGLLELLVKLVTAQLTLGQN